MDETILGPQNLGGMHAAVVVQQIFDGRFVLAERPGPTAVSWISGGLQAFRHFDPDPAMIA